jgi:flagellar biosynthesis protein FliR
VIDGAIAPFLRIFGFVLLLPWGFDHVGLVRRLALTGLGGGLLAAGGALAPERLELTAACGEVVFGALIALPVVWIIGAAMMWGELFDAARGESIGGVLDPSYGTSAATALILRYLVWALLLTSGILTDGVILLSRSHEVVPFGAVGDLVQRGSSGLSVGLGILTAGIEGILPWLALFSLWELGGIFLARIFPQLPLSNEHFLGKTVLGLALVIWLDGEQVGAAVVHRAVSGIAAAATSPAQLGSGPLSTDRSPRGNLVTDATAHREILMPRSRGTGGGATGVFQGGEEVR